MIASEAMELALRDVLPRFQWPLVQGPAAAAPIRDGMS